MNSRTEVNRISRTISSRTKIRIRVRTAQKTAGTVRTNRKAGLKDGGGDLDISAAVSCYRNLTSCNMSGAGGISYSKDGQWRKTMFRTISMRQFEAMLENGGDFLVLDVRSEEEFSAGHVSGAVNLPFEELEERFYELPRGKPIVVYCAFGSHSMRAARFLDSQGFYVINTAGGLSYYRGRHFI